MWEPDQPWIRDRKLPDVDIILGILPSPAEFLLVIAWNTPGDSGCSQASDKACDLSADPRGRGHCITHPRIPSFSYAPTFPCRHISQ